MESKEVFEKDFKAWAAKVHTKLKHHVFQLEVCPNTQKLHVQGAFNLHTGMEFKHVKKLFPDETVHIAVARNWTAAMQYCTKTDSQVVGTTTITASKPEDGYLDTEHYCIDCDYGTSDVGAIYDGTFAQILRTPLGSDLRRSALVKEGHDGKPFYDEKVRELLRTHQCTQFITLRELRLKKNQ